MELRFSEDIFNNMELAKFSSFLEIVQNTVPFPRKDQAEIFGRIEKNSFTNTTPHPCFQIFCPLLSTNHLAVTKTKTKTMLKELFHLWKEVTLFLKTTIHGEIMLFKSALWQP